MSIRIIAASDVAAVDALLSPRRDDDQATRRAASRIVEAVRRDGDAAVARYAAELDGITGPFEITRADLNAKRYTFLDPIPVLNSATEIAPIDFNLNPNVIEKSFGT